MAGSSRVVEREFTATYGDLAPPSPVELDIPDGIGIHSEEGARTFGFEGALVIGVNLYARSVSGILEAVGEEWLDHGWVHVRWRRPTLPGTELHLQLEPTGDAYELTLAPVGGEACMVGEVGLGDAPWLEHLLLPENRTPEGRTVEIFPIEPYEGRPTFELAVGKVLRPMAIHVSGEDARAFGRKYAGQPLSAPFTGSDPVVHPALVATTMVYGLYHSYGFGDEHQGMAVGYHIQNLRRPIAGREFVVTGQIADMYERKGHHYALHDGALFDEDGIEYARLRHTVVVELGSGPGD